MNVQQTLVVSRLVGEDGVTAFRRFVQLARRLSQLHGVRGAMLFDGETAVHLMEGEAAALGDFIGAVHGADTSVGVHVVASRSGQPMLQMLRWCVGYVEPLALDDWGTTPAGGVDAAVAIANFMDLLAAVDCV